MTARSVALVRSELERPSSRDGDPTAEDRLYAGLRPVRWPMRGRRRERIAARTRFFDHETVQAIADGVGQVVIVGAGYDGRALRFRSPGVRFFEVDHPATQADKRRRVRDLGVAVEDLAFVPVDLMQDGVESALRAAGHDPNAATLFLCEGLLLYLPKPVVAELFEGLRAAAGPGSRLALSTRERPVARSTGDRLRDAAGRTVLAAIGEPRRSRFAPGEVAALLERGAWKVTRAVRREQRDPGASGAGGLLIVADPI